MRAILEDEAGDRDGALADYQKVHELAPASECIPDEYLKEIDAKAYDARVKKREEAAKAAAEAKKTEAQKSTSESAEKAQKTTGTGKRNSKRGSRTEGCGQNCDFQSDQWYSGRACHCTG